MQVKAHIYFCAGRDQHSIGACGGENEAARGVASAGRALGQHGPGHDLHEHSAAPQGPHAAQAGADSRGAGPKRRGQALLRTHPSHITLSSRPDLCERPAVPLWATQVGQTIAGCGKLTGRRGPVPRLWHWAPLNRQHMRVMQSPHDQSRSARGCKGSELTLKGAEADEIGRYVLAGSALSHLHKCTSLEVRCTGECLAQW